MNGINRIFYVIVLAACLTTSAALASMDVIYTSTRSVVSLAVTSDGTAWAATRGGVLRISPSGVIRKFTQVDGLPANEVVGISAQGDAVTASFVNATGFFEDERWTVKTAAASHSSSDYTVVSPSVNWGHARVTADLDGLTIVENRATRKVPLPPSTGSHVSALLPRGDKLWVAMFGDGIYEFGGKSWRRVNINIPDNAREITAIAGHGANLWIGTRRDGVWKYDGKSWSHYLVKDEPYDHNCQNLCAFGNSIFISTLEDGLIVQSSNGWSRWATPDISSNAPRQMVVFGGCLYVRHGNGRVDRFDGKKWTKDVFSSLPRKQTSTIAADGARLYAAQWGGWSEFNGKTWTHHLKIPNLQGLPITALLPDGDTLWVGTQGRGLACMQRSTEKVEWHDESLGMPDDYIRSLAKAEDVLFAGTFCGGLAKLDGAKWASLPGLADGEITALLPDGKGGAFIATRKGVFHRSADGGMTCIGPTGLEAQALCVDGNSLWIGARTGLVRCELQ
jgi:ligand-binding sensor domain-containing protein